MYKKLIKDLEELNKKCVELDPNYGPLPLNTTDVEKQNKKLLKKGKLIVDFYRKTFTPKYLPSQDTGFQRANNIIGSLAYIASQSIEKNNNFGLKSLLRERGSKISDPNTLEELILELKDTLNQNQLKRI